MLWSLNPFLSFLSSLSKYNSSSYLAAPLNSSQRYRKEFYLFFIFRTFYSRELFKSISFWTMPFILLLESLLFELNTVGILFPPWFVPEDIARPLIEEIPSRWEFEGKFLSKLLSLPRVVFLCNLCGLICCVPRSVSLP